MNIVKSPRLHQSKAIELGISHFKNNDRGQLHMACGTGKTLTSLWIAKALKATKIVIVLPSLQLQEQSLNVWMQEAKFFDFELIAIGSDKSFSKKYKVNVTTDIIEIQEFLKKKGPRIVFSTYQSYDKLVEASDSTFVFDFGIIDEAHNTAGHNEKKYAKLLLGNDRLKLKKMLFMTGTPKFFNDGAFVSMDNELVYGKVIYTLTTEEAINQNILSDYKILVMYISESDLLNESTLKKSVEFNKINIPLNYFALKTCVEKTVEKYKIKKLISFHNSKERALKFSKILNGNLIKTYNINCSQNVGKRIEIVEKYKNEETACICNPRIMIEGFDLPEIDSIIFSDIKNSKQDISQAIGRALRRCPHKNLSYILLPIFLNKEGIINKKEYTIISELLASVSFNDNRIYNYFKYGEAAEQDLQIISPLNYTNAQLNGLYEALKVRVWKKVEQTNYISFDEFKDFIKTNHITSLSQYYACYQRVKGMVADQKMLPRKPYKYYKDWKGWNEIFERQTDPIVNYEEFKATMLAMAKDFGINNSKKYFSWAYSRKDFGVGFPNNFPSYPAVHYKEWISWYELFNKKRRDWLPYEAFKIEVLRHANIFKSNIDKEYFLWSQGKLQTEVKFPENFPICPSQKYIDWEGWRVILNKNQKEIIDYQSFKSQLLIYKEKYGINNSVKYFQWAKERLIIEVPFPINFPKSPANYYKKVWEGWDICFENKKLDYNEFKEKITYYFENYNLNNGADYLDWARGRIDIGIKFPDNMPRFPNEVYNEWEGWNVLLKKKRVFLNYTEFVHSLSFFKRAYGVDSSIKYRNWSKNNLKLDIDFPKYFPRDPSIYYKEWQGWTKIFN